MRVSILQVVTNWVMAMSRCPPEFHGILSLFRRRSPTDILVKVDILMMQLATISSRSDPTSEIESSSKTRRKVSAKELESKARLQDLIDRHAPSKKKK